MSKGTLIDWKDECEAIHREMDNLLKAIIRGGQARRRKPPRSADAVSGID